MPKSRLYRSRESRQTKQPRTRNKSKYEPELTGNLQTAQLTSFLLHPARPGWLLSHTAALEPTTARRRD
ncbi:Hypothetical predicted protein [Scomber scombrus]|uniref:Uncharacterized protein n=1 Tax=Scomber scombrus TaxID=13677 RepID=A0AAV1N928_SCOSC